MTIQRWWAVDDGRHDLGKFVLYDEHVKEVERLKKENASLQKQNVGLKAEIKFLKTREQNVRTLDKSLKGKVREALNVLQEVHNNLHGIARGTATEKRD